MSENTGQQWLVVHLYYAFSLDEFLVQAVKPFLDTVLKTGIASQYYFNRSRVRGQHIKLYIHGDTDVLEQILKPNLLEHFNNYFERYPSDRLEPQYSKDFPAAFRWQANNSVLFDAYLPDACFETDEDAAFQCVVDKQYKYSSELVIGLFSQKNIMPSFEWVMIRTLEIQLTLMHAMGFDLDDSIQFFQSQYDYLIPYALSDINQNINETIKQNIELKHIEVYEETYRNQRDVIIFPVYDLWKKIASDSFENEKLSAWVDENKAIHKEMEAAFNELQSSKSRNQKPTQFKRKSFWTYYQLFFSNTNNRLGITRKDESLIAFFLVKCLKEIKSTISKPSFLEK